MGVDIHSTLYVYTFSQDYYSVILRETVCSNCIGRFPLYTVKFIDVRQSAGSVTSNDLRVTIGQCSFWALYPTNWSVFLFLVAERFILGRHACSYLWQCFPNCDAMDLYRVHGPLNKSPPRMLQYFVCYICIFIYLCTTIVKYSLYSSWCCSTQGAVWFYFIWRVQAEWEFRKLWSMAISSSTTSHLQGLMQ